MADNSRGAYKGYTEARKRANQKYDQSTDRLTVRLPKGKKQELKDHCDQIGKTMNVFVVEAIQQKMDSSGK